MAAQSSAAAQAEPAPPIALKDYFLPRDAHLDFRSCAKLNTAVDNVLPRPPSEPAVLSGAQHPGTFEFILNTHCQILVCKSEVIAVVASGAALVDKSDADTVVSIKDPRIVIAANPDPSDYKPKPDKGKAKASEGVDVKDAAGAGTSEGNDVKDAAGAGSSEDKAVKKAAKKARQKAAKKAKAAEVKDAAGAGPSEGNDVKDAAGAGPSEGQRLKKSKSQKKREKAERTDKAAEKEELRAAAAREAAENPPHKVTLTKIDVTGLDSPPADVVRGVLEALLGFEDMPTQEAFTQHVRTYFQYLRAVHAATTVAEYERCVERLRRYVFLKSYPKMLSRFETGVARGRDKHPVNFWQILTRKRADMPEHARDIAMPDELNGNRPNPAQAARIVNTFKPTSSYSQGMAQMTVYTTYEDRLRFHMMLRAHLIRAKNALGNLRDAMDENKLKPAAEMDAEAVTSAVENAERGVSSLLNFLDEFKDCIAPHLEFLAKAAGVVDLNNTATWEPWEPRATRTPMPYTGEESSAPSQTTDIPDASSIETDSDDDDDNAAIAQAQSAGQNFKAWALACAVFLRLPCLHEKNLRRATVAKPTSKTGSNLYESALIMQAQVTVVNFEMRSWDNEIAKIDVDFIKKLRRFQPGLDPEKLIAYLSDPEIIKVGNLIQPQNPTTTGTTHCETMLMCLIVIAKTPGIMSYVDDKWLRANGIFATPEDLLCFPDNMTMVAVTKASCPPCEKVRAQMKDAIGTTYSFAAPGTHNKWSGILLPSFMPTSLGDYVVESTMTDTARNLLNFQNRVDAGKAKLVKQKETPPSGEHGDEADKFAANPKENLNFDVETEEENEPKSSPSAAVGAGVKRTSRNFTADRDRVEPRRDGPA